MARYKHKDRTDLQWNRIRRIITRELDTIIMNRRESALNALLAKAWEDYSAGLGEGSIVGLQSKYTTLVDAVVDDVLEHSHVEKSDSN